MRLKCLTDTDVLGGHLKVVISGFVVLWFLFDVLAEKIDNN